MSALTTDRWEPIQEAAHAVSKIESASGRGDLVFNHIPKTAGTFVKSVLKPGILINGTVKILHERMYLQPQDFATSWTMGVIRNPCDWLVSKWAWLADITSREGYPVYEKDRPQFHTESELKDSPEDIQKFRDFVRSFHGNSTLGEQSILFATSYLQDRRTDYILTDERANDHRWTPHMIELKMEPRDFTPEDIAIVKQELERFDPNDVNCWIRTESAEKTLQACLRRFEQDTNIVVNWTLFDERVASSPHNPSDHGDCSIYYDDDTEAYVRQLESYLFDRFDYKTCCDV